MVHLNPSVGVDWVGCPFCTEAESMFHLFVQCLRLGDLFFPFKQLVFMFGLGVFF